MPKLTVYVKTYNRPELLRRAVESVLNQTFTDFDFIIIDNGSTDNTGDVIREYMREDSRISCITLKENARRPYLFEKGFIEITEENRFLTVVDDDDYVHRDMVDTLYRLAVDNDSDISTVGSRFFYSDGHQEDKFVYDGVYNFNRVEAMWELLKREKINAAIGGKLYKKELYFGVELPKLEVIRDIHKEYRVLEKINKMTCSGKPMYYFYRHESNMSGLNTIEQLSKEKLNYHLYANRLRTEYLRKRMPEIGEFVLYSEFSFMISLAQRVRRLQAIDAYEVADYMIEELTKNKDWLLSCGFLKEKERDFMLSL